MAHIYIVAALVVAGWAAAYVGSRRALKRTCDQIRAEVRLESQRQIDALSENVRTLERRGEIAAAPASAIEVPDRKPMDSAKPMPSTDPHGPVAGAAATGSAATTEEITPEILRTITETVTALLGRKIRIRSVRILQTPDAAASSWAEQGRAVIQASHNLIQRGHE